jgi:putative Mg2+ transporter-C (MgtC) family protein
MMSDADIIFRLSISAFLGGLIGVERQWHRCNAGLRTHILVSLGSCLIMLTSIYVSDIYSGITRSDPARIAAGVITGIGFLGAGTIIRDSEGIRGLTTAASLWVVAGIGLASGCGFYKAAEFTAVLALVVLVVLRLAENKYFQKYKNDKCEK